MSKSKSKGAKDATIAEKVKDTVVNKPVKAAKAAGRELAKPTPVKEDKKSKKKVKEPTPESSDSESDATASTASSDESESESEDEVPVKNGKVNGVSLKQAASSDASDDESDSSESSDEEAPKLNGKAAAVNAADSEQDSDDSEEDSDEETVVETIKNKGAVAADELSKKLTPVSTKRKAADSSDEDSDDSAEDEEEDEAETGDDSDEEEEAKPKPAQKRKAEEAAVPAAKKTKTEEVDESRGNNLFVGNLSWNVDEAWLTSEFESYGELSGVRIITDRDSGRSKGFGYVEFVNAADAAKAFDEMKGHELDGRAINVDFAAQRTQGGGGQDRAQSRAKSYGDTQSPPSDTLFVGNLSFDVGQDTVSQAFGEFGTIMGVRLPTDRETGNPKGFGYVTFASVEEAQGAMEAMQGYELEGRTVRLDYSQPRPQNGDSPGGRGGFGGRGRGRGGFDRGGRGGGRGRGGFGDRGGRGGRGGFSDRGGRGGSTNRGGFGDFKGKKVTF